MDVPSTPAQPTEEELFEDQDISIRHFGVDEPEENIHLGPEDVKVGTTFRDYDEAISSMKVWSDKNFIPLVKRSTNRGTFDDDGDKPGRIQLVCTHGVERKSKATKVRPCQRVYYTVKKTRGYVGEYKTDGKSGSGTIMDCQFSVGPCSIILF